MSKNNYTSTPPGNKLVPKLRFPEFKDSANWVFDEFSEYIKLYRGSSPRPIQNYLTTYSNGVNWIKIGDTKFANNFIIENVEERITTEGASKSRKVFTGELILANSMSYGKTYLLAIDGYIYDGWFVLREYEKDFDKQFLFQLLNSDYMQNQYKKLSAGGIVQNISSDIVYKTILPHTLIEEQQKIADCLSSLDDLITSENQKLELLKAHKKGLMQNLFPADTSTGSVCIPKLRFKEFEKKWKNLELGSLIEIKGRIGYRGYTTNDIVNKGEGAISLSPSNIDDNNVLSFEKCTYISWEKYDESPEIMLFDGYTVLVKTGSSFGKAALIKGLPEKTTINPQLVVLKPTYIQSNFLFLMVSNTNIQKQIRETVVGGAIPTLSQESISKFEVLIPPDKEKKEQQKIADCLSSLDDLITAQSQKIEALKEHKKGLMQGLFPKFSNLNE